jgi:hypothetical protein
LLIVCVNDPSTVATASTSARAPGDKKLAAANAMAAAHFDVII